MQRLINFLAMMVALGLAGLGGAFLASSIAGGSKEFSIGLGIFLLALSQLLLVAHFWR